MSPGSPNSIYVLKKGRLVDAAKHMRALDPELRDRLIEESENVVRLNPLGRRAA